MREHELRLLWIQDEDREDQAGSVTPSQQDTDLLDAYSQAVVRVVDAVSPAVVSIGGGPHPPSGGSGSGFIISPDGLAITNSHVVDGRRRLQAQTSDGDRLDVEVVGDDPATDLSLLRLKSSDLPWVHLGDSDALRVGQLVIAVGSPLGLHSTVSTGVVSALGRSMRGRDGRLIEQVVQHAAPINPGNSGGPLLDSRGRVVGVNTAIVAMAQGLGFAVPVNTARWVAAELLQHGRVGRRQLGVSATTLRLPRRLVRELDLLSDEAVLIRSVQAGGPADAAGVLPEDVLIAINGRLAASVDDVHRLLSALPPQTERVELELVRGQRRVTLGASLAD